MELPLLGSVPQILTGIHEIRKYMKKGRYRLKGIPSSSCFHDFMFSC
jgi:hypothetical protein